MTPEYVLDTLGDRPVAFHPTFADVAGSALAGLFLSQAMFWQKVKGAGEWFYKTREEWHAETRMTRREQERARKQLVSLGILEEERRGVPAKLYYRVNLEVLTNKLVRMRPTSWYEPDQQDGTDAPNSYTESTTETTTEKSPPYPPRGEYSDEFEQFWELYPKRAGGNPKRPAYERFRSLVKRGQATVEELLDGVRRYAAFCEETDKVGTEFVKQAKFWLSPGEALWKEAWTTPEAEQRAEFERQMEAKRAARTPEQQALYLAKLEEDRLLLEREGKA